MAEWEAGAETDAAIAERVLGWRRWEHFADQARTIPATSWWVPDRRWPVDRLPTFSRDIAAAMQVVDAWDGDWNFRRQNGHWHVVLYRPSEQWSAWGATLPLAICRARLAAESPTAPAPPTPR